MKAVRCGLITVYGDGSTEIQIDEKGYPGGDALIPAPFMTEDEIENEVKEAKKEYWMQGYYIQSVSKIRNPAFDKPDQMTTTKITFRACKNKGEAEFVLKKFKTMVDQRRRNNV